MMILVNLIQIIFLDNYVSTTKDGFSQIDLIIEGIHCAACVWLNEKVLYETKGIVKQI